MIIILSLPCVKINLGPPESQVNDAQVQLIQMASAVEKHALDITMLSITFG
jgi:hypothetical protein